MVQLTEEGCLLVVSSEPSSRESLAGMGKPVLVKRLSKLFDAVLLYPVFYLSDRPECHESSR